MKTNLYYTTDLESAEKEIAVLEGRIIQIHGQNLIIVHLPDGVDGATLKHASLSMPSSVDAASKQFIDAWHLMNQEKTAVRGAEQVSELREPPAVKFVPPPTSYAMVGKIAVNVVIVQGPDQKLKFSSDERTMMEAAVMQALGYLAPMEPKAKIKWVRPDTVTVDINAQPPSQPCTYEKYRDCEDVWLIPVLQKLGVYNIEEYNRRIIKDQPGEHIKYAYTIFFTKYPGPYHAYAKVNEHEGGVIMLCQYYTALDSMAKTLAHETCHVFGAEDEYSQDGYKNCTCNPTGYYNVPNYNCVNCRNQDWSPHQCMMEETAVPVLCSWSRGQIGWNYVQFSNALGSQQSYGPETRTFSFECNTKTYMFAYSNESWSVWELTQMGPGDYPVAEGKVEGEWNIVVPYEAHDQDYQMWNLQEYTAFIFVQCQDKKWFIAKVPLSGDTLVPIIDGESDCLYSSAFSFISANGDSSLFAFEDVGPGAVKHPWSILSISKIRGTREPESLIKQSGGDFDYNYSVAFSFMYKQDQNSYAFPYIYAQTATECKWFIAKLTVNGIERVNTGKLDAYYSLSAPFVNLNDPSDNPYMLALDTREVWPIWVIVQLTDTGNRLGTVLDSGRMKATSIMLYTWNNKNYILKHESPEFGSGSYWRTLQFAAGAGAIFTV